MLCTYSTTGPFVVVKGCSVSHWHHVDLHCTRHCHTTQCIQRPLAVWFCYCKITFVTCNADYYVTVSGLAIGGCALFPLAA